MTSWQELAGLIASVLVIVCTRLIDKYTGPAPTTEVDKPSQPAAPGTEVEGPNHV